MRKLSQYTALVILAAFPITSQAHFPWLTVDDNGQAIMFFGEGLQDRTYHLPESIAKAELVWHLANTADKLEMLQVDEEKFVGLKSKQSIKPTGLLAMQVVYGDFQGMQLIYYAQHNLGDAKQWNKEPIKNQKLQAIVRMQDDGGSECQIVWEGKPLADADVTLFCEEGHEEGKAKTNAAGVVVFSKAQVEDGLNAILVGHKVQDATDKDAKAKEAHYMTATFRK